MNKTLLAALLALSLLSLHTTAAPPAERFEEARARAHRMGETDEGKAYEKRFSDTVVKPLWAALEECTKDTKPPYAVTFVVVISADGTTQRIIPAPDQPVSACVAKKLNRLKLPAPPKGDWMVLVNIAIKE